MKKLKVLIKIATLKLEELFKAIAILNEKKRLLEEKNAKAQEELRQELQNFQLSEYAWVIDDYRVNINAMIALNNLKIQNLDAEIHKIHIDLYERFTELKRFEIAYQNRKAQLKLQEQQREIKDQDANNIALHNRGAL